jgi:hypothetical protein
MASFSFAMKLFHEIRFGNSDLSDTDAHADAEEASAWAAMIRIIVPIALVFVAPLGIHFQWYQ